MGNFRAPQTIIAAYFAVAVITFGHAASNNSCKPSPWSHPSECPAISGIISAALWPLYWSWTVQS